MNIDGKQLSNPFSTGGGGPRFEVHIQAAFVTLMLSGGYAPCLPTWPIKEIKLQAKIAGYATDDLIVFVENPTNRERKRLLGQIKHSISFTESNKIFGEVILAAWHDFNNSECFTKGKDVIALITGPISKSDTDGVRWLLDHARHTRDAEEFITQISQANFCSNNTRNKLKAFQEKLKIANQGSSITNEDLYNFLKHFYLLGYDLDRKGSVVSSLLQSHIAQFNKEIPDKIWYQIVKEVQDFNQNSGTINIETLPTDLIEHFREPKVIYIPRELYTESVETDTSTQLTATDWNQHQSAQKLAIANLIGSWNENNQADIEIVERISGEEYNSWIADLRETLQIHDCPLIFKNAIWSFKDRISSWEELGSRIFENHLKTLKDVSGDVLQLNDPSFELPNEKRFAASIYDKVLPHSYNLREGLAQTLALIGNRSESLTRCTQRNAELYALLSVRDLLQTSSWIRWGSLSNLLPTIAEASPNEFLSAVEEAIETEPSPFDILFKQEEAGIFGHNYTSGLLWALEGLAWEESTFTRTTVVLAELASHDPGGNWANRPINSLIDIFLPWLPHTLAPISKRQSALRIICLEQPEVGWQLLGSLLPSQHSSTTGTHKPIWRSIIIPDDWGKSINNQEYWEQTSFCAELLVEEAGLNGTKLAYIADNYDHLPSPASVKFRNKLVSEECLNLPEEERVPIWTALIKFIAHHRRYSEAKWALEEQYLMPIETIAEQLAPKSPILLSKRLFSEGDMSLYESNGNWHEEEQKLFEKRKAAIEEILNEGELPLVIEFISEVTNPRLIGEVLGDIGKPEFDEELLPRFLDTSNHTYWPFIAAYSWRRRYINGWEWFDAIDKDAWEPKQIALLLCALPFASDAWNRAGQLLGDHEGEYWKNTNAQTFQTEEDTEYALKKLMNFGRPSAVIRELSLGLHRKQEINPDLACDALLALVQSEESSRHIESYDITKIIKALQLNVLTDPDKLFRVEWAFLAFLERPNGVSPITLENRLSSDPSFFCELIQLMYRSRNSNDQEELPKQSRDMASNAYRLLGTWKVVPGSQIGTAFDSDLFREWLRNVEESTQESGHYNIAMSHLGQVLVYAPAEENGLWIHPDIAEAMNSRDRSSLRNGYSTGIYNSRGAYTVDPEGKPERALAVKYRQRAEDVENAGYQRLATTLRSIAERYDQDADRIISNDGLL